MRPNRWVLVASAAILTTMTALPASADGVSGVPGAVSIDDGLRGSTVFRNVTLFNDTGTDAPFRLEFTGDIAGWMRAVDPDDRESEVTEVTDEGDGAAVLVRIDVPDDTPVGAYEGRLQAALAAPDELEGSGATVSLGVRIRFDVNVTGDQVIAGELLDASALTTEVGLPLRFQSVIENTGNTTVVPEFALEILTADGEQVSRSTTASEQSFPGEQARFETLWDTTGAEPGDYVARLSVAFGGLDLGTEEREFQLLPAGSLGVLLVLESLEPVGTAIAGRLASFEAVVGNPDQAQANGSIRGEVTAVDGTVVTTYESPPFLVLPDESLTIPVNLEVADPGDYVLTATVAFGDNESAPRSVDFTVVEADAAGPGPVVEGDDGGLPWLLIVGSGVLLAGVLAGWLTLRRRGDQPSHAPEKEPVAP